MARFWIAIISYHNRFFLSVYLESSIFLPRRRLRTRRAAKAQCSKAASLDHLEGLFRRAGHTCANVRIPSWGRIWHPVHSRSGSEQRFSKLVPSMLSRNRVRVYSRSSRKGEATWTIKGTHVLGLNSLVPRRFVYPDIRHLPHSIYYSLPQGAGGCAVYTVSFPVLASGFPRGISLCYTHVGF
jgi:hypothetical protein